LETVRDGTRISINH